MRGSAGRDLHQRERVHRPDTRPASPPRTPSCTRRSPARAARAPAMRLPRSSRRVPAVLVDAAEDARRSRCSGLALASTRSARARRRSPSTRPVQRERELLPHHGASTRAAAASARRARSSPPMPSPAVGEEEIDHDLRLVLDRGELGFDGAHRLRALCCGPAPAAPSLARVAHLIAEHVCLRAVDCGVGSPSSSSKSGLSVDARRAPLRAVASSTRRSRRHPSACRPARRSLMGWPAAGATSNGRRPPSRRSARCWRAAARAARRARRTRLGSRSSGRRRRTRRAAVARTSACG